MTSRTKLLPATFGIAVASTVVVACATIIHGSSQEVGISSQPTGATITVDGVITGKTPVAAKLSRKDMHRVAITMDGYQPFEITTTRKTSGWVWGNLVFGGLIGLAVDAITGALYNVRPEQIAAQLSKGGASVQVDGDHLYVILVPNPDPSWRQIAQLKPLPGR
jgi:PEGA domain